MDTNALYCQIELSNLNT